MKGFLLSYSWDPGPTFLFDPKYVRQHGKSQGRSYGAGPFPRLHRRESEWERKRWKKEKGGKGNTGKDKGMFLLDVIEIRQEGKWARREEDAKK